MTTHPNPIKYNTNNWILIAKEDGTPWTRGEGVEIFKTYEEAWAKRNSLVVMGAQYIPTPLV